MKTYKVFCYGTLKHGQYWHNDYLNNDETKYIGEAKTGKELKLYIDALPFMVKEESKNGVKGELYEVSENVLKELDQLEGHPRVYQREHINVTDENGVTLEVFGYLYPNVFRGKPGVITEDEYV